MPTKTKAKRKVKKPTAARARKKSSSLFNWKTFEAATKKVFKKWSKTYGKNIEKYNPYLPFTLPVIVLTGLALVYNQTAKKTVVEFSSAKLSKSFNEVDGMTTGDKIAYWSDALYHNPSLLKVLGKGPEVNDTSPLFPPAYDCTTYVETVGALARSANESELASKLIEIRYKDSEIGFVTRNHFPEADWIPNNESVGVLKDITLQVARKSGFIAAFMNKDINKRTWFEKQKNEHANRALASSPNEIQNEIPVRVPYVPMERFLESVVHVPNGAILNVVRENKDKQPVLITHQGFLIWKNGIPYIRHASRYKEITEAPLKSYIRSSQNMPWKVVGFNIGEFQGS